MTAARAADSLELCDNPACRQRFEDNERRLGELETSLRAPQHGIFDTLHRLELQFTTFATTVTASVKTTVFLGSAGGALVGAIFSAAVAIGIALLKE